MNFSDFMRTLSLFLRYPDDMHKEEIEKFEGTIKDLKLYRYLSNFIAYYKSKPTLDLQEYYVSIFDLIPKNSLCMLDHMHLNNSQKGYELVKIKSLYNEANFPSKNNEMPDYIPLFFEYLSNIENNIAIERLGEYILAIKNLHSRLLEYKSPYYGLFEILLDKEALDELL